MPFGSSKAAMMGAAGAGGGVELSGGTEFEYGGDTFMKFTSSGTLTVSGTGKVDYLVVAGGGGGGYNSNSSWGSGGGGGGGGVAWGTQFWLDSAHQTTYAITVGSGGAGSSSSSNGSMGGASSIVDLGENYGSTFDWAGGTSFTSQGDGVYCQGGAGGGQGDWGIANTGSGSSSAGGSTNDWGSAGGSGGSGGWSGYSMPTTPTSGGYRIGTGVSGLSAKLVITSQNGDDSSTAYHMVVGSQPSMSASNTFGACGRSSVIGTASGSTGGALPTTTTSSVNVVLGNEGMQWLDGEPYGCGGTAGGGAWLDRDIGAAKDRGGGQGGSEASANGDMGQMNGKANHGGGGAGGKSNYTPGGGSTAGQGGSGSSGIVIFRIVP